MSKTPGQYFAEMPASFRKDAAGGMVAVYQFQLSGEGGGRWFVRVRDGGIEVGEGEQPRPDVTIRAAAGDYVDIAEGRMNAMLALMTGRLAIEGNLVLAMKLQKIFKPPRRG